MQIRILQGDITEIETDVIVNAANSSLMGGGGVDGAIHRKSGKAILAECIEIRNNTGECKPGDAVITTAGNLPAKHVIHTVGPYWKGGRNYEDVLLASCYSTSISLAIRNNLKTISFPNISTGVYGFPKQEAAEIVEAVISNLSPKNKNQIEQLNFVCFDDENFSIYQSLSFKFKNQFISSLFYERPEQYGLRGDPYLWEDLIVKTSKINLPKTSDELEAILHKLFQELTGKRPERNSDFFVGRYSKGGMSSGQVCSDFWLDKGFPLILNRHKEKLPASG